MDTETIFEFWVKSIFAFFAICFGTIVANFVSTYFPKGTDDRIQELENSNSSLKQRIGIIEKTISENFDIPKVIVDAQYKSGVLPERRAPFTHF
jgi:hypothetical protein